jgi:hypothetical protein
MVAKWEGDEANIRTDVKAWHGMRERGKNKGNAYMGKKFAKWKAEREKANDNFERMMAEWRTDREKWKAEKRADREEVGTRVEAIHDKTKVKEEK